MATGIQTYDRFGTLRLDSSAISYNQLDYFEVPAGSTSTAAIVKTFSDIPSDMTISHVLVMKSVVTADGRQLAPTVTINQGARTLTAQPFSQATTDVEGNATTHYSQEAFILVLGK